MTLRKSFRSNLAIVGPTLFAVCVASTLLACEAGKAEIRGTTARVVGDRVILDLIEGDEPFSPIVSLQTADGTTYDREQLRVERQSGGRTIELYIPPGVATGPALLEVGQEGSERNYEVPLTIDRLAVFLTDQQEVHLIPLSAGQVAPRSFKVASTPVFFSVSEDASTMAVVSSADLLLLRMTGRTDERGVTIRLPSGAVHGAVALPDGAIVALEDQSVTPSRTLLQRYTRNDGELSRSDSRTLQTNTVRAIAAVDRSPSDPRVAVLAECAGGGDCVAWVDLKTEANDDEIEFHKLDDTTSAASIALGSDGLLVAVPDTDGIYGIFFDEGGQVSKSQPLSWNQAEPADPVGIARTRTLVGTTGADTSAQDVFAAVDRANHVLRLFGAPAGDLRELQQQPPPMGITPLAFAFGRDREIYLLSDQQQLQAITAGNTSTDGTSAYRTIDIAVPAGAIDFTVQR